MRWSFRIARLFGIDVRVHATFFLLLVWIAYRTWAEKQTPLQGMNAMAFTGATFAIVVLHELGHALMARAFGIKTKDITLLPIGGLARLERMPDKPWQELLVAIAGPAVNVVLFAICIAALAATDGLGALGDGDPLHAGWLPLLAITNAILAIFNMLPAFPMDGGRVLRAVLAMHFPHATATMIAARLGQAVAILFVIGGFLTSPGLALIGFFVWIGAGEEYRQVRYRSALAGIPVWNATATEIRTLAPGDTLERAALFVMRSSQTEFPVVEGDRPVGLLTRNALVAAISQLGVNARVDHAMSNDFATVAPGDPLDQAYLALQASPSHTALVVHEGKLVGILTPEDINELAALQGAIGESTRRGHAPPKP